MKGFSHFKSFCAYVALAGPLSGCATTGKIPVGQIPTITKPTKRQTAKTYNAVRYIAKKKGHRVVTKGEEYARVKRILDRLTDALGTSRGTWPLYLMDGADTANASAVNQNTIVVYTGLIRKISSDDQLAAILGHEIAHIAAKHGKDKNADTKKTATAVLGRVAGYAAAIGASVAGVSVSSANSLGSLAETGTRMVGAGAILSYDRTQEYEADHVGMMVMAKAGYNPREAIHVWKNAKRIFGSTNSFSFLSTHPSAGDRVSKLEDALQKALNYYRSSKAR